MTCFVFFSNHSSPVLVDVRPAEAIAAFEEDKVPISKFGFPSEVFIHRGYSGHFKYDDIAVLGFPEYVDFGIEPVKLANNYVDDFNDTAIAAGYGRHIYNGKEKLL